MTDRLYYTDAYTLHFTARVVERLTWDDRPALVLDRSAFYPDSGGQPHDTGTLGAASVLDVQVRAADGAVIHVLDRALDADEVEGVIDPARRFDHMQHHTGQHILSGAFERAAQAETVSFHLGTDSVTIDLDRTDLTPAEIDAAEDLANAIVTEDRPVRILFPTPEETAALALRKVPDVAGDLRVVDVDGFDVCACGGTHVARTGAIGLIKVLRTDRNKDLTRVEFRCGGRALRDYREKNAILLGLAAELTTGYWEIGAALDKLRDENRDLRSSLKTARQQLLEAEAGQLWAEAGDGPIVRVWDAGERDPGSLRELASLLVSRSGTAVLLGLAGERAQIVLARDAALPGPDMVGLLRGVMAALAGEAESRRGGGRPDFAQGGGVSAPQARLAAALADAAAVVRAARAG